MKNCFAVIFYNKLKDQSDKYGKVSQAMIELAQEQDGYVGIESVRDAHGLGITVSYWRTLESIHKWKSNVDHMAAQSYGIAEGYEWYHLTVAKVQYERSYNFN